MNEPLATGIYSTATAAEYMGLSKNYLHNMRHHGKGPAYRKEHGRVYYTREALDAWNTDRLSRKRNRADNARSISARRASKGVRGERKAGRKAGYDGKAAA